MRSSLLQSLSNVYLRNVSAFSGCASACAPAELLAARLATLTRGFHAESVPEPGPPLGACQSLHGYRHDRSSFLLATAQLLSLKVSELFISLQCNCCLVLHFSCDKATVYHLLCAIRGHTMLMCRASLPVQLCGRPQIHRLLGSTPSCKLLLQFLLGLHPLNSLLQPSPNEQHKLCCAKPRSAPKS